jgi:hypothetical protein
MREGAKFARRVLGKYEGRLPLALNAWEIDKIAGIIEHHDDPKIPIVDITIEHVISTSGPEWWRAQGVEAGSFLMRSGAAYLIQLDDKLLQYHHEADALWMITEDGIAADLGRFPADSRPTFAAMLRNNKAVHSAAPALYFKVLSATCKDALAVFQGL